MLVVLDRGVVHRFGFEDLLRYAGPHSPGGVAHAYKVLERALPLLAPDGRAERRAITVATAFAGPGARDGFELVTRAVTDGRFRVDPALARPELGRARERFVFHLAHRDHAVTLVVREGFVTDEFVALAGKARRSAKEEAELDVLKRAMAHHVLGAPAGEVYEGVSG